MTASYQIIYWRDIPAQVKVRRGGQRVNRPLSARFQEAIDEAAMRAQSTSTDDYLEEWQSSDWQAAEGEAEEIADALVAKIEAEYSSEHLSSLKANKGHEPSVDKA